MFDYWETNIGLTEDAETLEEGPRCGEPAFYEPWHAKVFSLTVAIINQEDIDWNEFETRFVDEINRRQSQERFINKHGCRYEGFESVYYRQWISALERLLVEKDILKRKEIEQRNSETGGEESTEQKSVKVAI